MGTSTFTGPVVSTNGFVLPTYLVAAVPSISTVSTGTIIYVSDAATNATIAFSDGTNWLRADTGAVLS